MPVEAFDGNGMVSKLEILRGDLVDVLYQPGVGRRLSPRGRTRPGVRRADELPAGIGGYAPMSNSDIVITAQMMKWMQRRPFRSYAAKKFFTTADSIDLPDYR